MSLQIKHVFIAGIGGVGAQVAESLARNGIGNLTLVDFDIIDLTNINRQVHALHSTIGMFKVEAMKQRLMDINPSLCCMTHTNRIIEGFNGPKEGVDYLIDCVDDVVAKTALILWAKKREIPVISSMGSANRLDNRHFEVTDIGLTHTCPLARSVRKSLREHGIEEGVKICYNPLPIDKKITNPVGTMSYVPPTCGLIIAGEVIRDLMDY